MNYVRKLLEDARAAGLNMVVRCEGEIDYKGDDPAAAEKAITDVDEAQVNFYTENGHRAGWALIVNGLDEDERIADTSGQWVNEWCERNISYV